MEETRLFDFEALYWENEGDQVRILTLYYRGI